MNDNPMVVVDAVADGVADAVAEAIADCMEVLMRETGIGVELLDPSAPASVPLRVQHREVLLLPGPAERSPSEYTT